MGPTRAEGVNAVRATTTSEATAALRPVLVRWPARADRRASAAAEGRPCLLVVEAGAEIPVAGELEDWVRAGVSEIDVAARLEALEAFARSRPIGPRRVPVVPAGLRPGDRGVARVLLGAAGSVVPRALLVGDDGGDGDLDEAVARVRLALADTPWRIERVGRRGFVARTEEAR